MKFLQHIIAKFYFSIDVKLIQTKTCGTSSETVLVFVCELIFI